MKDYKAHLEKLETQIVECEMIRDLATDPAKRDMFDKMASHFRVLAGELKRMIGAGSAGDTFVGRKTQEPFPKEDSW